jgi:hypothetical protein
LNANEIIIPTKHQNIKIAVKLEREREQRGKEGRSGRREEEGEVLECE